MLWMLSIGGLGAALIFAFRVSELIPEISSILHVILCGITKPKS